MEWSVTRSVSDIDNITRIAILQHYESEYEKNECEDSAELDGYQFLVLHYQHGYLYIYEAEEIEEPLVRGSWTKGTEPFMPRNPDNAFIKSPAVPEINPILFPICNIIVTLMSNYWMHKTLLYKPSKSPRILTIIKDGNELILMDRVEFIEIMKRQVESNGNQQ